MKVTKICIGLAIVFVIIGTMFSNRSLGTEGPELWIMFKIAGILFLTPFAIALLRLPFVSRRR